MAAGSTIKMGVDVTQFKQGMRDAQNSVKTLDAELKKSKAEFAATGDKEKYMADQSKILKQKLEAMPESRGHLYDNTAKTVEEMCRGIVLEQYAVCVNVCVNGDGSV